MKKLFFVFLLMLSLSFILGCDQKEETNNNDNNDDNINDNIDDDNNVKETLEITETNLTLNVGETYTFNVNVEVVISSSNQAVVSVNDKTITALKEGNVKITITLKSNEEVKKEVNVKVAKKVDILDKLEKNIILEKEEVYTLSINGEVTLSVQEENILELDSENKTIKALAVGSTVVTVCDANDNTNSKTINVTVLEDKITEEEVNEWLFELYGNKEINEDIEFVETYKDTDIFIDPDPLHKTYLKTSGKFTAPLFDTLSKITFYYDIEYVGANGESEYVYGEYTVDIVLKGYGNEAIATLLELEKMLPEEIEKDYQLPVRYDLYSADIKWYFNGELIEDGLFIVEEDLTDSYNATIKAVVTSNGNTEEDEFTIFVSHLTKKEKIQIVKEDLQTRYSSLDVDGNVEVPYNYEQFEDVRISWNSWVPHILTNNGKFTKPIKDATVYMQATVYLGTEFDIFDVEFKVKGENPVGTEAKVEAFLDRIALSDINNKKFILYGWETIAAGFDGDYTSVPTYNLGYIFFYTNDALKQTEDIIPITHAGRPGTIRKSTNFITIHNTGMAHPQSTAEYLNEYIHTDTTREASWHFSIDDKEAYQHLPLNEVGWHAGDGSSQYGGIHWNDTYKRWCINGGNQNSIGIENCVYKGVDYNMVMRNLAKLVAGLLVQFNLTTTDIRQHYDFSGKDCPQVLRQSGRWSEQLQLIELEYYALTELQGLDFEWKSLTPDVLDDTGKVLSTRPTAATKVAYKVNVTGEGFSKEYTFESTLKALTFKVE